MKFVDDRTEEQKQTHKFIIIGTDSFMSGWGECRVILGQSHTSYAGWACTEENRKKVMEWVESRSEMKRVREVYGTYQPNSRYCAHCHIYVVGDKHPSLN